jgi:3alpha(or 20beta)-hydroxysteroid dehydrogenase
MGQLDGKVAIITGAAQGMGAAEARMFAAEGAQVVLGDIQDDLGAAVATEIGEAGVYEHLDVRCEDDWARVVPAVEQRFGRLDILVNNAGINRVASIATMPMSDYYDMVATNQTGPLLGMRAVLAPMIKAGGGSIINISSFNGLQGLPGMVAYTGSKFAVRGMTKVAAMEFGRHCIRVNSVHPWGIVETSMGQAEDFSQVDSNSIFANQPIARTGRAVEVARMVVYLASDQASYCTGAEFVVDGGYGAGPQIPGLIEA